MNKREFTRILKGKINHLPKSERRQILQYYYEMISERMEDGMTEAEAIEALGNIDELLSAYTPVPKEASKGVRLRGWHIALIIIGSPLWICLAAALLCIMLAFYIVIWAVVIAFYAVFVSFAAVAVAAFFASFISLFTGAPSLFFAYMGVSCLFGGLAILWFMLSTLLAKGIAKLTAVTAKGIFRIFFKRR